MVTHHLINKTSIFTGFDRFSKFLLLGNDIDGFVNVDMEEFASYSEAMKSLPAIFGNLEFGGEWNLSFYQVPEQWKITKQFGYYRVPKTGKKIFEFSYMHAGDENEIFLSPALIHISCTAKNINDQWEDGADHFDFKLSEEYYTIHLKEHLNDKSYKNENYPGDITALYKEVWN